MAQYFSINAVRVGGIGQTWPGTLYSDATDPIALLQTAGVVLKPATNATIAAAAARAQARRAAGGTLAECESIMTLAYIAAASGTVTDSATIALADLTGLAGGVTTFTKNIGAVQPAGQVLESVTLRGLTGFDDGAAATYVIDVGWVAVPDALASAMDVAVATATGYPKPGDGASAYPGAAIGGFQLQMKITSAVDLNTTTAGSITVDVVSKLPV